MEFSYYFTKEKKVYNEEADRRLYDAIQRDDIEEIDKALLDGADIDDLSISAVDGIYTNPVAIALFEGQNRQTAKYLIEKGANPDQKIQYGITVLTYGVMNDLYDLAKYMLENGANPNVRDDVNNATAMDYAVQNIAETRNLIEMIDLLISHGADPDKSTVLYLLTGYNDNINEIKEFTQQYNVSHYLITYMSEKNIDTGLDKELKAAITGDSKNLLKYLKKGKVKEEYRNIILEYAAAFCEEEVLSYMFEHGYSYKYRASDKSTLLMVAAYGNNIETMSYLYELGVGIEETNVYPMQLEVEDAKETALLYAVKEQSYEAVEWLLQHGARIGGGVDIHDENHYVSDELWELSQNCDTQMLKIFVDFGYYISEYDASEMIRSAGGLTSRGHSNSNYDEFVTYVKSIVGKR